MEYAVIKNHSMLTHGKAFAETCEPIFRNTPINYIGLAKIYDDGARSYLISNPAWGEILLSNNYHLAGTEDALLDKPDNSYYPWFLSNLFNLNEQTQNLFTDCVAHNYGNGITLLEHGKNFVEFIHICADSGYEKVDEYLTNNIDKLWNFVLYIRASINHNSELKQAYGTRYHYNCHFKGQNKSVTNAFIKSNKYYLGGRFDNIYFSSREMDCLMLLAQNKTAKEQAVILNLSPRTIEEYHNKIKQKTGCKTQIDLLVALMQNNSFKSILRNKKVIPFIDS